MMMTKLRISSKTNSRELFLTNSFLHSNFLYLKFKVSLIFTGSCKNFSTNTKSEEYRMKLNPWIFSFFSICATTISNWFLGIDLSSFDVWTWLFKQENTSSLIKTSPKIFEGSKTEISFSARIKNWWNNAEIVTELDLISTEILRKKNFLLLNKNHLPQDFKIEEFLKNYELALRQEKLYYSSIYDLITKNQKFTEHDTYIWTKFQYDAQKAWKNFYTQVDELPLKFRGPFKVIGKVFILEKPFLSPDHPLIVEYVSEELTTITEKKWFHLHKALTDYLILQENKFSNNPYFKEEVLLPSKVIEYAPGVIYGKENLYSNIESNPNAKKVNNNLDEIYRRLYPMRVYDKYTMFPDKEAATKLQDHLLKESIDEKNLELYEYWKDPNFKNLENDVKKMLVRKHLREDIKLDLFHKGYLARKRVSWEDVFNEQNRQITPERIDEVVKKLS